MASPHLHRSGGLPRPCFVRVLARQRSPVRVAHLHRSEPLFLVALSVRPAFVPRRAGELAPHRRLTTSALRVDPGARIISSSRTSRPLHRPWRCGSGRSSARTPRRASGRQPYPRSTDQDHSRSGRTCVWSATTRPPTRGGERSHNIPNPERMGCSRRRCARGASGLESAPPRFHSLAVPQRLLRRLSTKGLRCADGAPPAVTLIARFPCRTDVRISGRNLEDQ